MDAPAEGPATVRVAGAISGVLQLDSATVGSLRREAARLAGCDASTVKLICGGKTLTVRSRGAGRSACLCAVWNITLACAWAPHGPHSARGRRLARMQAPLPPPRQQDDSKALREYGWNPNSRVLVTRGAAAGAALGAAAAAASAADAREARIDKLKTGGAAAAAAALNHGCMPHA